jgi:hypothetical protein
VIKNWVKSFIYILKMTKFFFWNIEENKTCSTNDLADQMIFDQLNYID